MRRILAAALIAAAAAVPAAAAPALRYSWGKAGIAYDAYRLDADACLRAGEDAEISGTPAAQALVLATRRMEAQDNSMGAMTDSSARAVNSGRVGEALQPYMASQQPAALASEVARTAQGARWEQRVRQIRAFMQREIDQGLAARGYQRFRLTGAQRARLRHLDEGAPERHFYLHSLASDPAVLAAQGE